MFRLLTLAVLAFATLLLAKPPSNADDSDLPRDAERALRKACGFFHDQVSCQGGYLWRYGADLQKREGEGQAAESTVWVQPPGTPSVGQALLDVHFLTGDDYYLELAVDAGRCLVRGQLRSGGWDYRIESEPLLRKRYDYRVDALNPKARNTTTLDDDTTQSALRFLMRLDQALEFEDHAIHEAAQYGLHALLAAQYPNGAWPQRFSAPPDAKDFPVLPASYPESWSRKWTAEKYSDYYTTNDNAMPDVIGVMLLAERIYADDRFRQAALRGADFLLLAQMPEPQPGWAQQYNRQMQPAWARKFEPPAITGSESAGVMKTLLAIYRESGERKYLDAVGRALDFYRQQRLSEGGLARFYELQTNRPLYFTRDYQLTYDDSDMPTHYAFKIGDWTLSLTRQYESLASKPFEPPRPEATPAVPRLTENLETGARQAIGALDARGAWVESGQLKYYGEDDDTRSIIDCRTFIQRTRQLATYLAATRAVTVR